MGVLVQVVATVFLCFSCFNFGISIAWPSSTLLLFKSENTTLHRPMSDMDETLFTSLPIIGALVTQPMMTMGILDKLGLKRTSLLTALLYVIAWLIIAATNQVEIILLGVVIQGCATGNFILVAMYVSEIAQDTIRGTLSSCPNIFVSIGLLISYLLGGILDYYMMVYTCLSFAVIGVVLIAILRESPVRLMLKGREEETAEVLAFYRQTSITSKEVLTELNNIRRSLNKEVEDALSLTQVADQVNVKAEIPKKSCWQLFKTTSSIRRQFYLAMVLQTAFIYQGLPSLQVYAEPIFAAAVGDDISPNLCSVVFGAILIVAGIIAAYLIEKIGRRPLQIHSSIVCGICCLFLGTQVVTNWFPSWTMLLFMYIYATSHTLGAGTVTFVVAAEIFLPEVKSNFMILLIEWENICYFSCMFLFSIMIQSVGLALIFYFFSIVCFITGIYFYYYLPETKGLSVYAIQALFTEEVLN